MSKRSEQRLDSLSPLPFAPVKRVSLVPAAAAFAPIRQSNLPLSSVHRHGDNTPAGSAIPHQRQVNTFHRLGAVFGF